MKRASYREGVEWIALNDEPMDLDPKSISWYISVCLLSDLFKVSNIKVATDILKIRIRESKKREST